MIKERPVLGSGLGTFGTNFSRVTLWNGDLVADAAHNDYLQILCDTGVIGALISAGAIVFYFYLALNCLRSEAGFLSGIQLGTLGGITAILIHSLFDFNLHIYSVALTFSVFVILPFCLADRDRKTDSVTNEELSDGLEA